MAYIIGITGSIATGKSTVSSYIKEKGYQVVDSDQLAYDALTIDKPSISLVKKEFPEVFINNQINRTLLAEIIFSDKEKQSTLNSIVHPYVITHLEKMKQQYDRRNTLIFFDIPLLYEAKLEYLCNEIWVVYTDKKTQLKRLIKRNQLSKEQANARIQSQMDIEEKKKKATKVLYNQGSIEELYEQIEVLMKEVIHGINGK